MSNVNEPLETLLRWFESRGIEVPDLPPDAWSFGKYRDAELLVLRESKSNTGFMVRGPHVERYSLRKGDLDRAYSKLSELA